MNNYYREIVFGIALLIVYAGLIFWFAANEPQAVLQISIAIITLLLGMVAFIWRTVKKRRDDQAGEPPEDEFTKLARVYAGNRAFLLSMYLWLLIFIFNSSFTKHETMLGIGILGSALIYGLSLWYYSSTGKFYEE